MENQYSVFRVEMPVAVLDPGTTVAGDIKDVEVSRIAADEVEVSIGQGLGNEEGNHLFVAPAMGAQTDRKSVV